MFIKLKNKQPVTRQSNAMTLIADIYTDINPIGYIHHVKCITFKCSI